MNERPSPSPATGSDRGFILGLSILGGSYIVLIVGMLICDAFYTTPEHLRKTFRSEEVRFAIKLSLVSCTITTILALWVAVPLGYLLSRTQFFGKGAVDTILDIPIVLPPLVIGMSLLILFQFKPAKAVDVLTSQHMGFTLTYVLGPLLLGFAFAQFFERRRLLLGVCAGGSIAGALALTPIGDALSATLQRKLGSHIPYTVLSVILAQFAVATAFAVRTMRVTFDQISPRTEHVALTLGCARSTAFWLVTMPQARRGLMTAATLAWARSLGEFGPILIFSGATRMRTEVLSTTVFLEFSIGNLHGAMAVSLLMVVVALAVLVLMRVFGLRGTGLV